VVAIFILLFVTIVIAVDQLSSHYRNRMVKATLHHELHRYMSAMTAEQLDDLVTRYPVLTGRFLAAKQSLVAAVAIYLIFAPALSDLSSAATHRRQLWPTGSPTCVPTSPIRIAIWKLTFQGLRRVRGSIRMPRSWCRDF
jgi:DNA polymerase III psi subunit